MKLIKSGLFAALLITMVAATLSAQSTSVRMSPDALVTDLYKTHAKKRGPFDQERSRALLDKYFEKSLADLIWHDRVTSKGEVGVIDGDPLYDAQDFDIKNLVIGKAAIDADKAKVNVSFENLGEKKNLVFLLVNGKTGWKISDIDYGASEGTMRSWFKDSAKKAKS